MMVLLFRSAAASTNGRRRFAFVGNQRNISIASALVQLKQISPPRRSVHRQASALLSSFLRFTINSTHWISVSDNKLLLRTARSSFFSSVGSSSWSKNDDGDDDDDDVDNATLQDEIDNANQRYAQRVVVREDCATNGWGVFAAADCAAGSIVLEGRTLHPCAVQPDAHSIQTSRHHHVRMDLPARFLNHACGSAANVGARMPPAAETSDTAATNNSSNGKHDDNNNNSSSNSSNDNWTTVYEFVAKRDIARGEQLRFDYETTEWALRAPFDCACGSADCRGTVAGFGAAEAAASRGKHDRQWIAPHLLEMLDALGQDNDDDMSEQKKK